MKTRLTFLLLAIFASTMTINAQMSKEECTTTLSLFSEPAKIKNYEAARPYFNKIRTECPDGAIAFYQLGERMLKADLKKAAAGDKTAIANDLIAFLKQREQYFPAKTKKGQNAAKIAQILTDNKIGTAKSQFDAFDAAWKKDKNTITDPKNIYTYFKLAVDAHKANQYALENVFDLYDEVKSKMNKESNSLASKLAPLLTKQDNGQTFTSKEKSSLKRYETNLRAFSIFSTNTDVYFGDLADCPNLIPFYGKDFETKKNDIAWVKEAAGRIAGKDCTDDPLFIKLVEQLHNLEPSAKSAKYLGILALKNGDTKGAINYFNQSADLETENSEKADVYRRIANLYKKQGSYGQARSFYNKVLDLEPSCGRCYLNIAAMYNSSANNCGDSNFNKRAVYWLAAKTAEKAARVNPSLKKNATAAAANYRGKAPSKSEIFTEGKAGQTIKIGCWIGRNVSVPSV